MNIFIFCLIINKIWKTIKNYFIFIKKDLILFFKFKLFIKLKNHIKYLKKKLFQIFNLLK